MAANSTYVARRTFSFLSAVPVLLALTGGALTTVVVTKVSTFAIDTGAIFSGVFDLTTILVGFLATFYVFVVARQNKFLENIQFTKSYRDAVGLLRFDIYWAGSVIALSWVCMIADLKVIQPWSWQQAMVAVWSFNTVLLGVNFTRSVGHFHTIITARNTT